MIRRLAITFLLVISYGYLVAAASGGPTKLFVDLGDVSVAVDGDVAVIRAPERPDGDQWRLLTGSEDDLVGWFDYDQTQKDYRRHGAERVVPPARVQAWLVPRNVLALARDSWPETVPLRAAIDSLSPGGRGGWIRAEAADELAVGQSWWVRAQGQPVARMTIVFADSDLAYGRLTPLAAEAIIAPGQVLERWVSANPGRYRTGVCSVADGATVWIAAPSGLPANGQRVVFMRHGEPVGRGTLTRADDRFGYVTRSPGTRADSVRVGDQAVVEPLGAASARLGAVFAESADRPLVDVGEIDGLTLGEQGVLSRDGEPIGSVTVARLQKSYAGISWSGTSPRPGDRVQFGPRPDKFPETEIEAVADGSVFVARRHGAVPVGGVLVVRDEAGVVGAVALVFADGGRLIGFAIDGATRRALLPGDRITDR